MPSVSDVPKCLFLLKGPKAGGHEDVPKCGEMLQTCSKHVCSKKMPWPLAGGQ